MNTKAISKLQGYIIKCQKDYRNGQTHYDILRMEGVFRDLLRDLEKEGDV